ncbi:hypothetical protein SLS54_010519 [Diplodia seriata]
MKTFAATSALLALAHQALANLDVVTLQASTDAWIQEATATLVVGDVPNPITGDVALWSAIMMQNEASFLQGVTENAPEGSGYCTNLGSNWCNFAYALIGSNAKAGTTVKAAAGSRIKTHYKLNSDTQMWDQNLYVNDELVSSVSTSKGEHGELFYISIECWEDVSIVLSQADESFGHTGGWEQGATGGEMTSSDGGKTWNFTTLEIPDTDVQH